MMILDVSVSATAKLYLNDISQRYLYLSWDHIVIARIILTLHCFLLHIQLPRQWC